MSTSLKLRQVQKRIIRLVNYEDGLWDLLLGLVFMLQAIYPITRARLGPTWNAVLHLAAVLLAVWGMGILRRSISTPRLGYVQARRSPGQRLILAIMIALVTLSVGLVILTLVSPGSLPKLTPSSGPTWARLYWVEIITLLVTVTVFSAMAHLLGVPRLYLYGWLLGVAFPASQILHPGPPNGFNLPMGFASGVILLIGAGLLIRFLIKHPVRPEDA